MFLKPFRVKTQTSIKASDRKKLRSDIQCQFPSLSDEDVAKLIPTKEEMMSVKINTHGDDNVIVYSVGKVPVFYHIFKSLFPTVYTMWQHPDILPSFRTWPPVFEKLQKGADLMLPGVIPDNQPSPKMFGTLKKGDLVSVKIAGNKAPVALGKALLSGEDMYMSGLRGKGVQVLHILGDSLWEHGDRSTPPHIPEAMPQTNEEDDAEENADSSAGAVGNEATDSEGHLQQLESLNISEQTDCPGEAAAAADSTSECAKDEDDEEEEEEDEKDPVAEMDELFNFCFACAVKSRVKKGDLPLLTSHFFRNYMQPFSCGKQMDLKKSSFKKLSKFLQTKVSEGYIKVKEQSKGVDVITEIDKSHLGLRDIQVPEIAEESSGADAATAGDTETFVPLTFTDVYCVNGATQDFFRELGYPKGEALLISEVRECVTEYIKRNSLQREDKKTVTLDPILAHIILKPAEGDLDRMAWEQVINRMVGKMQASVAISVGNEPPTVKKGKLDPIKITTATRASNKKVTLVENLEDFGIDVRVFARLVQKAVACSCSVAQSEQKGKGQSVTIQGNQITFVGKVLLEKYKIPKRYVTGLENAPKQKKR
ncbi:hypothetical protein EGW08_022044 [Elysia chlorotica]|uniref:Uncharacterized protein n=1 Tax=Elysia chlorotica TaxID=188477 RepID=A0A3S1AWL3_ELYCH|nr:hypothetical protein EGW08_022044 [Elysia chlorotica]